MTDASEEGAQTSPPVGNPGAAEAASDGPSTTRPWPAPSPDDKWWRGTKPPKTPGPPPAADAPPRPADTAGPGTSAPSTAHAASSAPSTASSASDDDAGGPVSARNPGASPAEGTAGSSPVEDEPGAKDGSSGDAEPGAETQPNDEPQPNDDAGPSREPQPPGEPQPTGEAEPSDGAEPNDGAEPSDGAEPGAEADSPATSPGGEPTDDPGSASDQPGKSTSGRPHGPYTLPPKPKVAPGARTAPPARRDPGPAPMMQLPPVPVPKSVPEPAATTPPSPPQPPATTAVPPQRRPLQTPTPPGRASRAPRPRRDPRKPWFALPMMVLIAFLTTFLAWVSAEPFWLAIGQGTDGVATVIAGESSGCRVTFTANDGTFVVPATHLAGTGPVECVAATVLPAQMLSPTSERAYSTDQVGLTIRWGVGFGLILLCGLILAWLSGAARFRGWRRGVAVALSLGAPVAITTALLTLTFPQ